MGDNEIVDDIRKLSAVLALSGSMRRLDSQKEPGSWRVAYSLNELRESVAQLHSTLLPKLATAKNAEDVEATLNEIGEQLRHVIYHVKDSGYFDYLLADA